METAGVDRDLKYEFSSIQKKVETILSHSSSWTNSGEGYSFRAVHDLVDVNYQ